jgi:hypothetical protein
MVLKSILKDRNIDMWTRFKWAERDTSGGLLYIFGSHKMLQTTSGSPFHPAIQLIIPLRRNYCNNDDSAVDTIQRLTERKDGREQVSFMTIPDRMKWRKPSGEPETSPRFEPDTSKIKC